MLESVSTSVPLAEGSDGRRGCIARPLDIAAQVYHSEWDGAGQAPSFDTGNAFQALQQLPVYLPAMRLIVAGHARIHFHQHAVVETESRLHIGGALGAANEKSGRREQHQREGNLANHQDVSTGEEPACFPVATSSCSPSLRPETT